MTPKTLKDLINVEIDPVIKLLGFIKNGSTYSKQEESFTKVIALQLSQWNTIETVSFTIECGIFFPDVYLRCFDKLPKTPKIEYCLWQYRKRIGYLKGNNDLWYELGQAIDNRATLEAIKNDINWYVRKYFDQYPTIFSFFSQ